MEGQDREGLADHRAAARRGAGREREAQNKARLRAVSRPQSRQGRRAARPRDAGVRPEAEFRREAALTNKARELLLDNARERRSTNRQDLVVEIVTRIMHRAASDRVAVADVDVSARALLQHEGEV